MKLKHLVTDAHVLALFLYRGEKWKTQSIFIFSEIQQLKNQLKGNALLFYPWPRSLVTAWSMSWGAMSKKSVLIQFSHIPVNSADTSIPCRPTNLTVFLFSFCRPASDAARLREPPVCPLQLVHVCCHNADLQTLGFPCRWAPHGHWETVLQQLPW